MKINLNENVKVKITEYGFRILEDRFNRLKKEFPRISYEHTPPKVDKDGYSIMQLHDVMSTFGKYMTMGMSNYPIDLEIIIGIKNDKPN